MPSTYQSRPVPSLSPFPPNRNMLIFDLDQTLIHCNESLSHPHDIALSITFPNNSSITAGINVRPYTTECLRELSKYFDIVIFTASHECYANVIIDYLDPKGDIVKARYFRDSCYRTEEGFYVKDLRVLGRGLDNMLLIDNVNCCLCRLPIAIVFNLKMGFPLCHFMITKQITN